MSSLWRTEKSQKSGGMLYTLLSGNEVVTDLTEKQITQLGFLLRKIESDAKDQVREPIRKALGM